MRVSSAVAWSYASTFATPSESMRSGSSSMAFDMSSWERRSARERMAISFTRRASTSSRVWRAMLSRVLFMVSPITPASVSRSAPMVRDSLATSVRSRRRSAALTEKGAATLGIAALLDDDLQVHVAMDRAPHLGHAALRELHAARGARRYALQVEA